MKSLRSVLSLVIAAMVILGVTQPARAAFNGVLPVPSNGSASVDITLSDYDLTVGETATVTITFTVAPSSFIASNITSPNGTISNFAATGDPKVFTATFTPTTNTTDASNVITVDLAPATTTYALGVAPRSIAFDGTNMWTANFAGNSVTKITSVGVTTIFSTIGTNPQAIAFDGTNMWTANNGTASVTKITPVGATTTYGGVGTAPNSIAFDGTNMWVATNVGSVTRIALNGATTTFTGMTSGLRDLAFDGTNMWVAGSSFGTAIKIAPNGASTTYSIGGILFAIAFDGTNMWTANYSTNSAIKITPGGVTTSYPGLGGGAFAMAFDGTNMWTANSVSSSVSRVTPAGSITTYDIGTNPVAIAFDGTNMWTANNAGSSVTKITPPMAGSSPNYTINTVETAPASTGSSQSRSLRRYTYGCRNPEAINYEASGASDPRLCKFGPTTTTQSATSTLPTSAMPVFMRNLELGMSGDDVLSLQGALNRLGFTVATSGAGSPGSETKLFGQLTRSALVRFQEMYANEILTPLSLKRGTGYFGEMSRTTLAALLRKLK